MGRRDAEGVAINYYEHHLGDYAKDTAHLTMLEDGAYRRLLDRYYSTESGIPEAQTYRIVRARTREEKQAVDAVLAEFFFLADGLWKNNRAEEEIEKFSSKKPRIEEKKENDKERQRRSRERRKSLFEDLFALNVHMPWNATTEELQDALVSVKLQNSNSPVTQPVTRDNTATQTPDTRHQIKTEKQNTPRFDARRFLVDRNVLYQQADDWLTLRKAKRLPATLTALEGIEAEAKKAGIDLPKAIAECCLRGWAGFKSDWLTRDASPRLIGAQSKHGDFSTKNYREGVNQDGSF